MVQTWLNSAKYSIPDFFMQNLELPVESFWLKQDEMLLKREGDKVNAFIGSPSDDEWLATANGKMLKFIRISSLLNGFGAKVFTHGSQAISSLKELGESHSTGQIILTRRERSADEKKALSIQYSEFLNKAKMLYEEYASLQDDYFFLQLALSFFYRSVIHPKYDSGQFVDAIICLEALFNDGVGDIRYKIALRAAFILGLVGLDAKKAFDEIGDLYNKRNHLIHGNEHLEKPKNRHTAEDIVKALKYARRCLICFNILVHNRKQVAPSNMKSIILAEIDHAMLDNTGATSLKDEIHKDFDKFTITIPEERRIVFDTEPMQIE